MGKTLSQTAFDFALVTEPEPQPAIAPVAKKEESLKPVIQKPGEKKSTGKKKKPGSVRGRRSLKESALPADLIQVPEDEILFRKQYYSIGEVATMFRENQSLIRYWETEFDILQPRKNRKGDRFFRPVDIKNIVLIYDLLRRRKFTIEGAKEYLRSSKKTDEKFAMIQSLEKIKGFLMELKANL